MASGTVSCSSINWEPKGSRLQTLVAKFGLRPATILFIDDNASNRGEAASVIPELQVRDETGIAALLDDPLLKGKDDPELTRLKQYKILEARSNDQEQAGADNSAFLRSSDIRVSFEYDVIGNIDRAIELINRTNQLNFTKRRLPEDPAEARAALVAEVGHFWRQSALIRVTDRYGDYGYCGFFLRTNGQGDGAGSLIHFCFSCRTLGMAVESWVYDRLGRPRLSIVGPVVSNPTAPHPIDWIRFETPRAGTEAVAQSIPEVRLRGGCAVDALAHYFTAYTPSNRREGSLARGPFFVAKDCSHHVRTPDEPPLEDGFLALARACGFVAGDFESEFFEPCAADSLFIYSGWSDIRLAYRHRASGRLLTPVLPGLHTDVTKLSRDEVEAVLATRKLTDAERDMVRDAVAALREQTDMAYRPGENDVKARLTGLFSSIPYGCKLAVLAIDEYWKDKVGTLRLNESAAAYNVWLEEVAAKFGATVFAIKDHLKSEEERQSTSHFDRAVYFRLSTAIISWATESA